MLDCYLVDPTEPRGRWWQRMGLAPLSGNLLNSVWRRYLELGAVMPDMADMLARMVANLFCATIDEECPEGGAGIASTPAVALYS